MASIWYHILLLYYLQFYIWGILYINLEQVPDWFVKIVETIFQNKRILLAFEEAVTIILAKETVFNQLLVSCSFNLVKLFHVYHLNILIPAVSKTIRPKSDITLSVSACEENDCIVYFLITNQWPFSFL